MGHNGHDQNVLEQDFPGGLPAPREGVVVTHLLIVTDQDRSREFYTRVFGAVAAGSAPG